MCRHCTAKDLRWATGAGLGTICSYTIIVDLGEGYQMLSNVIGCHAGDLHVGKRVRVAFRRRR